MSSTFNSIDISNEIVNELKKYGTLDWSSGDLILKLSGGSVPSAETISDAFGSVVSNANEDTVASIQGFLDGILALNEDFAARYRTWTRRISALQNKVDEIQASSLSGMLPKIHVGYIFISATDFSEELVREHFGSNTRWKRVSDFLIGTKEGQEIGTTGGQSCVSLGRDNAPNHNHALSTTIGSGTYTWNYGSASERIGVENASTSGSEWTNKSVFVEVAPIGLSDNRDSGIYPTPHDNVPTYRNVYIWECVDTGEDSSLSTALSMSARETSIDIGDIPAESISTGDEIGRIAENDDICFIGSDELQVGPDRYDSVQVPLPVVAEALARMLFDDKMDIRRRYLLKSIFKYLISDVQDRMFSVLKELQQALASTETVRLRVFPGQYVFIYGNAGCSTEEQLKEYVSQHYSVSPSRLTRISGVFLRGTTTFTPETIVDLYRYAPPSPEEQMPTPNVAGGADMAVVDKSGFPIHSHNTTVASRLNSIKVRSVDFSYGFSGTAVRKDDVRFTGVSDGMKSGTGEYEFSVVDAGSESPAHNNVPKYNPVNVFLVDGSF